MLDPDRIYKQLEEAGNDWADKKAAYETYDALTKTVLAEITTSFLPPVSDTKGEAEQRGLSSSGYKEHLAAKSAARRAWLLAEVKWKNLQTLAELRRSEESSRRAEMKLT